MAPAKINLAVFISGRGSNLNALIEACRAPDYPARIVLVLSNRPDASGLETAKAENIPVAVVDHKDYAGDRAAFENAIQNVLADYPVDLICLAGFMRILGADFIGKWPDKIINIHPSLLPAYKGLHTHERALADGVAEAGCTVHFVRPEMDAGPTILQKKVSVEAGDTPESLAKRVLVQEHEAYSEAVALIGAGKVKIVNETVEIC